MGSLLQQEWIRWVTAANLCHYLERCAPHYCYFPLRGWEAHNRGPPTAYRRKSI
jgi:hypothetical protein